MSKGQRGFQWPNGARLAVYIALNLEHFAFGEGLDGYDDPSSKFKNNAIDQYRQITIGFKYFFGNVTSYNKLILAAGKMSRNISRVKCVMI